MQSVQAVSKHLAVPRYNDMRISVFQALRRVKKADGNFLARSEGLSSRHASSKPATDDVPIQEADQPQDNSKSSKEDDENCKTVAEQDEQLRLKLQGISGGGGEAGLELEDGQPVAMKRSVKENMFRLI